MIHAHPIPAPAPIVRHAPTMAQYDRLKKRFADLVACLGHGVPVVVHVGPDGRQYLVLPDAATDAAPAILVTNGCTR